jgi:hypothetical protein
MTTHLHKGVEEEVDVAEEVVTEKAMKKKMGYKCERKVHPANKCPEKSNNVDDEKSVASATSSVKKLKKDFHHGEHPARKAEGGRFRPLWI